ncbi:DUF3099 domain-containing protein [Corynebacterium terpenotabidum]|uniref:DUF3099 domain-containing protein n=1 Tax=Corynebacterium terpenotabidum Y-11 TaxID=1200352 RepID=S4XK20_9CORY|nr:DUF3099 domain-containing protein [Corynebacterium terpenotabidum]AGP30908.1 hypothetical protein A606_06305 [Corynebacterium terpenotabidum Y-11]
MVDEDLDDRRDSGHGTGQRIPGRTPGRTPGRKSRRSRRRSGGDTVLITSAKKSPLADWRQRRTVYAALQLSRIPLFIIAVAIYGWLHNPALAAFVAVISLPLPWVAVLLANDPGTKEEKGAPKVYKPALAREQRARELQALNGPHRDALTPAPTPDPVIIDAEDPETPDEDRP